MSVMYRPPGMIDPRLLARLQAKSKKHQEKNEDTLRDEIRETGRKLKKALKFAGKTKSVLGQIYNILDSPSYYGLHNIQKF